MLSNKPYGQIIYNKEIPCIICRPTDHMNSETFREFMSFGVNKFIEMRKDIHELKWLHDSRKMKPYAKEDLKWLNEQMGTTVKNHNLEHMAFALPESIFGSFAAKKTTKPILTNHHQSVA